MSLLCVVPIVFVLLMSLIAYGISQQMHCKDVMSFYGVYSQQAQEVCAAPWWIDNLIVELVVFAGLVMLLVKCFLKFYIK